MSEWVLIKGDHLDEAKRLVYDIKYLHDLSLISKKAAEINAYLSNGFKCNVKPGDIK